VLLKGVGDVLQEDKPQDDVLVLRRVHGAAQGVGRVPELGLEAQVGRSGPDLRLASSPRHALPTVRSGVRKEDMAHYPERKIFPRKRTMPPEDFIISVFMLVDDTLKALYGSKKYESSPIWPLLPDLRQFRGSEAGVRPEGSWRPISRRYFGPGMV
jgi:hypothetical protein